MRTSTTWTKAQAKAMAELRGPLDAATQAKVSSLGGQARAKALSKTSRAAIARKGGRASRGKGSTRGRPAIVGEKVVITPFPALAAALEFLKELRGQ